ncbi:hypothetical protein [Herbaspirillum huttiense]|uniref:hypothetical protein n=1 Tax=Herbaspirillum huttiense TaxID=863372 RepID=UPI0031E350D7
MPSKDTTSGLEKIYKSAQIFALIVIPVVVSILGWIAQRNISDSSTNKDYIQIAIQVLREPRRANDEEIREWAIKLIAEKSPVPFSHKAGDQLSNGTLSMLTENPLLKLAMEKRSQCPTVDLSNTSSDQKQQIADLKSLCERNSHDLFWLQTYLRMILDFRKDTAPTSRLP